MTDVAHRIFRLGHGSDGQHFHHILLFFTSHILQKVVHRLSHPPGRHRLDPIAELVNEIVEIFQFFGIGAVMHPVNKYPGSLFVGTLSE